MSEPTVCAVMLTRDRPELAAKAVQCFRAQTYPNKRLFILDTGANPLKVEQRDEVYAEYFPEEAGSPIGRLRNLANGYADEFCLNAKIIVHIDDDDWSGPNRIAEQVALLQASGADMVGYNEMLFWRERINCDCEVGRFGAHYGHCSRKPGEAWLYSYPLAKPTLGTSLCYWRKTWERKPFNPKLPNNSESTGEDTEFIRGLNVHAVSSLGFASDPEPRMIARIHGSNTVKYNPEESNGDTWKRVPNWDSRIREIMEGR